MSGKDPFQILADEITLIRTEIERLQRTSLNKDEAKALHKIVTEKADDMLEMGPLVERAVESKLNVFLGMLGNDAVRAAEDAAERAVTHSHGEASKAAETLLQDAHRARRIALQQSGGFWGWMIACGAVCACLAVLATIAVQGRGDAKAFGLMPKWYCERAGGENLTLTNGRSGCMIWHRNQ